MIKPVIIGNATLYLGDCLEVYEAALGGRYKVDGVYRWSICADAVVVDPPYGIGEAAGKNKSRGHLAEAKDYGDKPWDNQPLDAHRIDLIRGAAPLQVIFGGNYYELPPSSCWLVWDKENGDNDFADCELAWTNLPKAVRRIRFMWNGMLRARGEPRGDHPTQKPVTVMEWSIRQIPGNPQTIMDPCMGSGTTGVACMNLGRKFIGIEIEPKYFDIACERIEMAQKQQRLFA